jgi:hypothetical protein
MESIVFQADEPSDGDDAKAWDDPGKAPCVVFASSD